MNAAGAGIIDVGAAVGIIVVGNVVDTSPTVGEGLDVGGGGTLVMRRILEVVDERKIAEEIAGGMERR